MPKKHLFNRTITGKARQSNAFTGIGFLPDLMSEHALTMMPEASASFPVNDGIVGRNGMIPPSGLIDSPNPIGNHGTGGAGSFQTVTAYGAKG